MEREEINIENNGFSAFRTLWPRYSNSIFKDKVEVVTDGKGVIIGVTNPLGLIKARIPSYGEGVKIVGIGERAFSECKNLQSISFMGDIEFCSSFAFSSLLNLKECIFSSPSIEFGEGVFASSGITTFSFPLNTRIIPNKFFQDASSLYRVEMGNSVKSIGTLAFAGTKKLRNIDLGFKLSIIHDGAFLSSAIESISLPHSLKEIGVSAFSQARNLKAIWYDGGKEEFRSIYFGRNWNKDIRKDASLYIKDKEGRWMDAFSSKEKDNTKEEKAREEITKSLAALGFESMPERKELGERYRELVRKFHPDTLIHLGLDREYIEFASRRFNEIHQAYLILLDEAK